MKKNEENKREYFRISDTIGLGYHFVPESHVLNPDAEPEDSISARFRILGELQRIELESRYLLRIIADKDRNLADYLRTIDRRIDLLSRLLISSDRDEAALPRQEVNISEDGIEFTAHESLEVGTHVALRLELGSTGTALFLYGRIVHSKAPQNAKSCGFLTGAKFVGESEADRQILARHILQLQMAQRRSREFVNV